MEGQQGITTKHPPFNLINLSQLFLAIAFPIHTYSIFQIFNNFSWIADRTRIADALGYAGYALTIAFIESLILAIAALPFYWLVVRKTTPEKAISILGITFLMISIIWTVYSLILSSTADPAFLQTFLERIGKEFKLRKRYQLAIGLVIGLLAVAPVFLAPWLTNRFEKVGRVIRNLFERLEVLTVFYLVLDAVGILTVIVRNLVGVG